MKIFECKKKHSMARKIYVIKYFELKKRAQFFFWTRTPLKGDPP